MRTLFSILTTLFGLGIALTPPWSSGFSTDCKYVRAITSRTTKVGNESISTVDSSIVVPIDVCYEYKSIPITDFYSIANSYKWQCVFDDATNLTTPVHYQYGDTSCMIEKTIYNGDPPITPAEYNCDSQITCPYAAFSIADKAASCGSSGNGSVAEQSLYFSTALNLCNYGVVFTCNESESRIYQWTYADAECTNYESYNIYQETETRCNNGVETKEIVTTCDMKMFQIHLVHHRQRIQPNHQVLPLLLHHLFLLLHHRRLNHHHHLNLLRHLVQLHDPQLLHPMRVMMMMIRALHIFHIL
eukprot:1129847_1